MYVSYVIAQRIAVRKNAREHKKIYRSYRGWGSPRGRETARASPGPAAVRLRGHGAYEHPDEDDVEERTTSLAGFLNGDARTCVRQTIFRAAIDIVPRTSYSQFPRYLDVSGAGTAPGGHVLTRMPAC